MGPGVTLIVSLIWFPQAIRQMLAWIYWWQMKEYRLDRFRVLLGSKDGRKRLGLQTIFLKLAFFLGSIYLEQTFGLILLLLLYLDLRFLIEIIERKARRPVFTQRARLILGTGLVFALLSSGGAFLLKTVNAFYLFALGEISLVATPFLGTLLTLPIVRKIKKEEISKARQRLDKVRPVVIGITGSYGKTSTKEFIAKLLSQKYKVSKTTGSVNTELGIAREIIHNLKKDTDFFVVEMGAYKRREINVLTQIARPKIGVITGVEPQHLFLFGSLEEIIKSKFELIEALPEGGIAVFNYANKHCRSMAKKAGKRSTDLKIFGYYFQKKRDKKIIKADMTSRIVSADVDGVNFEIKEDSVKKIFFAPVRGVHFIENLTGAILIARKLNIGWKQIAEGCKGVKLPKHIMHVYELKNDVVIVDDSRNTTPKGFESAIEYISLFKDKNKVVVTPGIIELGRLSGKVHEDLGRLLNPEVNEVLLTTHEFAADIAQGLGDRKTILQVFPDPEKLRNHFNKLRMCGNHVILLEGRMPSSLMAELEKHKNV